MCAEKGRLKVSIKTFVTCGSGSRAGHLQIGGSIPGSMHPFIFFIYAPSVSVCECWTKHLGIDETMNEHAWCLVNKTCSNKKKNNCVFLSRQALQKSI